MCPKQAQKKINVGRFNKIKPLPGRFNRVDRELNLINDLTPVHNK